MRNKKDLSQKKEHNEKKSPHGTTTREMILDAACKVFSRCPYEGASIRMIAAEGGFYHSLIRHHFPSKASIFEAISKKVGEDFREANKSWLKELPGLGLQKATSLYFDRFISYYQSHPEIFRLIAQNTPREDAQRIPGYDDLANFMTNIRDDVEKANILLFDSETLVRYLESLYALFNYYLGSGTAVARHLGFEPDSPEYLQWVKETMMFIFLSILRQSLKSRASNV
ncbi:MAG TPA: TetR/AcrR family transcriptional regulator [Smithella sp.]|nr:TetR/AcrR family transcriptional regulator [Smithella sp.]HNY50786.1 TetR/AcrR family transcriptional regulator [Smithella sp.]HOG90732.1 TetR/AcrR family transcriptional regulator [Smithella sp.]HOU50869.1 TetR/AcrR family transcriptional regulator [Smithella sp.]HQG65847.1 TetR/AcrR family transcriptional regulator [Smithella sp.]